MLRCIPVVYEIMALDMLGEQRKPILIGSLHCLRPLTFVLNTLGGKLRLFICVVLSSGILRRKDWKWRDVYLHR